MAIFKVQTKNKGSADKKPRVYFTCHPDDFEKYFKKVCDDIFKTHDCAIYYTEDMTETIAEDERETDLGRNNLFVVPVTYKLLSTPNRAMDQDIPYARKEHIPVLPVMMEPDIDELYSKSDKFGELQYLNPLSTDLTEISYEEKLKKYLESVLISDELAKRVRAAFDAYIFLSYRKKDRKYANELMRLIHSIPECRDIAIWFDEFLTPGESFKENIERMLDDCNLFTLLVTPQLLEKVIDENGEERDNYVISTELPLARKKKAEKGVDIFAVEMENTRKEELSAIDINDFINVNDEKFNSRLLESISEIALSSSDAVEHNFLIGLAYLDGIDVEVDRERALDLITGAADGNLDEAIVKLIYMYSDGIGVEKSKSKMLEWSKRLSDNYFKRSFSEDGRIKSNEEILKLFGNYRNEYFADTIKFFLVEADKVLPLETVKSLYEIVLNCGICEYTLLFDVCDEIINYQETTQIMLVEDILLKSVCGTYPPYGPLFWYIPRYKLYEVALLAVDTLKSNVNFAEMLSLVRDVCFIIGRKYTVAEITDRVNSYELYNAAASSLKGVRKALCELFCTGNTDFKSKKNIYPRCFDVEDSKSMTFSGVSMLKKMNTPFKDELGMYSHTAYNEVQNEYIGLISCPYNITKIENVLSLKSSGKLSGMILSPSFDTKMRYISFNRTNISVMYIPENIKELNCGNEAWDANMQMSVSVRKYKDCIIYVGEKVVLADGISEITDEMFRGCDKLKEIVIPSTVETIGPGAFRGCSSLESVNIPDSVTMINAYAFYACVSLKKIHIGKSITGIEAETFNRCISLVEVNIPEGVKKIGVNAFKMCRSLKTIKIPEGLELIDKTAFFGCNSLAEVNIPGSVKKIGTGAFVGCRTLAHIEIPEGIEKIETGTFAVCSGLKTVVLPDSLVSIDEQAFSECTSLTSVVLPDGISEIKKSAFAECSALESIHLPEQLQTIHFRAFDNCKALASLVFPEKVEIIAAESFAGCALLKTLTFPESVKVIDSNAFIGCKALSEVSVSVFTLVKSDAFEDSVSVNFYRGETENSNAKLSIPFGTEKIGDGEYHGQSQLISVEIPDTVTEIGKAAFLECGNLETVQIPDSVTAIGKAAFLECERLKSITIPDSVKKIEYSAFAGCDSLEEAVLPKYIKKIDSHMFCCCKALKSVNIPKGVEVIEDDVFRECRSLSSVDIPASVNIIGKNVFSQCSSIKTITLPSALKTIKENTFFACESLEEIVIPESVEEIERGAFSNCTSLISVLLPDKIRKISRATFYYCTALKSVRIPDKVTEIGSAAFGYCINVESIYIPKGVEKIEYDAFKNCTSLKMINLPEALSKIERNVFSHCENLESINIPESITEIEESAFENCKSVESIKIPEKVTEIGTGVFRGCENLKSVNIPHGITLISSDVFAGCVKLKSIIIPYGVKDIGANAFHNCLSLESIVVPDGVEEIGAGAFRNCKNLEIIDIPESVEKIGKDAFNGCTKLERVSISNSTRIIGAGVFVDCTSLSSVSISRRFEGDIQSIFGNIDPKIITYTE